MMTRFDQISVMVVEDHAFQRKIALRLLDAIGVERVLEAGDGEQALRILEAAPAPPDVLLVDLDLPQMDGIELIGHVASRRLARAVVVLSALEPALLNTVQTMARASGLRVLGVLEKPLTATKLAEVLALLQNGATESRAEEPLDVSESTLAEALELDEFEPWFQPQVAFDSGLVTGAEALTRWLRRGQVIAPDRFVPLIERSGLIDSFTERVLARACAWRRRWAQQGLELQLSVNISMLNLASMDAADRYQAIVLEAGMKPRDVVLELTESAVIGETAHTLNVLARLRLKGFGLSIDDFGTGYSSLAQLAQLPVTELKVDRGFVSGAPRQPRQRAVVEASLELARKLGLSTTAEGVETVEEWQMLADLGCDYAQGALIDMPVPGAALPERIRAWHRPGQAL